MAYSTRQRKLILEYLKSRSGTHLTAEDIMNALKTIGEPVSKATIYRYLDRLLETGEVRKYTADNTDGACYQYMGGIEFPCREHFHLKCGVCGRLNHIECVLLSSIEPHLTAEHNFTIDSAKTIFYGKCANCEVFLND